MTDDRLAELVRAAMPPVAGDAPSPEVWPLVVRRLESPTGWSLLDAGLAAAVIAALLMVPEWRWLLAYHL